MGSLLHKNHPLDQPPVPRQRTLRKVLLGSALVIVVLEIAGRPLFGNLGNLQIYDPTPTDGRCVALKRNLAQPYTGWMFAVSETVLDSNAYGFRGPASAPGPASTVVRIAVLGDSMTYGQGVAAEHTMPAYLERWLQPATAAKTTVEVLNFGIPGLNFGDFAEQVTRHILHWHPDLLLLVLFENDLFGTQCDSLQTPTWITAPIVHSVTLRLLYLVFGIAMYINYSRQDQAERHERAQMLAQHLHEFTEVLPANLPLAIVALGDPVTLQHAEAATHTTRVLDAAGFPWLDARRWRDRTAATATQPALTSVEFEGHLDAAGNRELARRVAAWLARVYPDLVTHVVQAP